MTSKDFNRYLDNPQLLREVSTTDLRAVALEFPYATNVRLLLLLKARLDGDPDQEALLQRVAAGTFDRAHLYDLLRELDQRISREEEVLELRDLEAIPLEAQPETSATPMPEIARETPHAIIVPEPPPPPSAPPPPPDPEAPLKPLAPTPSFLTDWPDTAAAFLAALPPLGVTEPAPEPTDVFATTPGPVSRNEELARRMRRLRQLSRAQRGRPNEVKRRAHRSLLNHGAVASETLAELLVQQGQYQNAIKVYRRLMLLNPDKKAIFAGLIEGLKQKL